MHRPHEKVVTFLPPEEIEPQAWSQICRLAKLPIVFDHVAVMPDCHLGKGATVGTVIATNRAIIPAAVGVDIGCGMIAVRTKFSAADLPENLEATRIGIERRIPLGTGGTNQKITKSAEKRVEKLKERAGRDYSEVDPKWIGQVGSLGSGNHFIEICLDEKEHVWVVLHSGSRGVGNRLAGRHIKIAQKLSYGPRISPGRIATK